MVNNKEKEFVKSLLNWFEQNKRDFTWRNPDLTPFNILIAEIMLQKTGANQVEPLFTSFIQKYPTVQEVSNLSEEELGEILKPLGLYKRRARDIKKTIDSIINNGGEIPYDVKELKKLPGVGEYIANAVACFAFNQCIPIVDANVGRVIKRVFSFPVKSAPSRDKALLEKMEEIIPRKSYREFNLALLDFAALVCLPRTPSCEECPLKEMCDYFRLI
ncbi:MAG: hypothetical protein JW891_18180 [Candidatus Lokiarchaeota archaeon]|nr:hypothetical protein [Candidatus Lokiarchaeota archaeon]